MAVYTNTKCGNCGYSFSGGYEVGRTSILGPSFISCPKCFTVNKTKAKPYSKFTPFNHFWFWSGRIIHIIIRGFILGSLLSLGLCYLAESENEILIIWGISIGLIAVSIWNYFSIKYEIKQIEEYEEAELKKAEQ